MNIEHRTSNIERRITMSLRSSVYKFAVWKNGQKPLVYSIDRQRRTSIRRWTFDVRCWTFRFFTRLRTCLFSPSDKTFEAFVQKDIPPRIGRTYPGPPPKVEGLVRTKWVREKDYGTLSFLVRVFRLTLFIDSPL